MSKTEHPSPANYGSSNYRTHRAVSDGSGGLRFVPTSWHSIIIALIAASGFPVFVLALARDDWGMILFSSVWAPLISLWALYLARPIVADKVHNVLVVGYRHSFFSRIPFLRARWIPFSQARGVQVLGKQHRSLPRGPRKAIELNLLLDGDDRAHLATYRHRADILEDANALSRLIGVPIEEWLEDTT